MIPYGRQSIDESDISAVVDVLKSDFLTQGPAINTFEEAFAEKVNAKYAVAVNSGTAALHASMIALGIGPGDEVIVPPITFTATANCVVFVGATPVFADVTASGHIDPDQIKASITERTKAVICVDYAGLTCDYGKILDVCESGNIHLVCDACHAAGGEWNGKPAGSIGELNAFSFHPVKHIAAGEGGMITTDNELYAACMREFRTHGITKDASRFTADIEQGPWHYEMHTLGYNYRMSDINAALANSQLSRLDDFIERRREIASLYYNLLNDLELVELAMSDLHPNSTLVDPCKHAFHLFPIMIDFETLGKNREQVMTELRDRGIGTQVHYIPVSSQPFYRELLGTKPGDYPTAETFFAGELSIPMYPAMTDDDVRIVADGIKAVCAS